MEKRMLAALAFGATLILATGASAQQPPAPPPYGSPGVTLDQAKKAITAAEAEAKKNSWRMAIVVVSNAGDLIHFSRIDDTTGNPPALPILTLGAIAVEGGFPLVEGGKVIGAIGCSGGTGAQDSQACQAGVDTIK